jgi:Cu/Ag efflux pump CusA
MENCDVCGIEANGKTDEIRLYTAQLLKREYSKTGLGSRKTTANYEHFRPVAIHACQKHRREFAKQSVLPGVIIFVLIVIPVLFLLKLIPGIGSSLAIQLPLALLISLIISLKLLQILVRYDNFIALMMTIKEKRSGSEKEFLTATKYKRYSGRDPKLTAK